MSTYTTLLHFCMTIESFVEKHVQRLYASRLAEFLIMQRRSCGFLNVDYHSESIVVNVNYLRCLHVYDLKRRNSFMISSLPCKISIPVETIHVNLVHRFSIDFRPGARCKARVEPI